MRYGALFFVALSCVGVGTGFWYGYRSSPAARARASFLYVEPKALDIGEVILTSSHEISFPIENRLDSQVHILGFRRSCNCTEIQPASLTIPAHGKAEVHVTIDIAPQSEGDFAKEWRAVQVDISPTLDGKLPLAPNWRITGTVRATYALRTTTLALKQPLVRGLPPETTQISFKCHSRLKSLFARCDQNLAKVALTKFSKESQYYTLNVTPHTNLTAGPIAFAITLVGRDERGQEIPPVTISARGTVLHDVKFLPAQVAFAAQQLGTECTETLTVASRSGKPVRIRHARCAAPDIDLEILNDGLDGRTAQLQISVRCRQPGEHSQVCTLTLDVPDESSPIEVSIPVSWYGLRPNDAETADPAARAGTRHRPASSVDQRVDIPDTTIPGIADLSPTTRTSP